MTSAETAALTAALLDSRAVGAEARALRARFLPSGAILTGAIGGNTEAFRRRVWAWRGTARLIWPTKKPPGR